MISDVNGGSGGSVPGVDQILSSMIGMTAGGLKTAKAEPYVSVIVANDGKNACIAGCLKNETIAELHALMDSVVDAIGASCETKANARKAAAILAACAADSLTDKNWPYLGHDNQEADADGAVMGTEAPSDGQQPEVANLVDKAVGVATGYLAETRGSLVLIASVVDGELLVSYQTRDFPSGDFAQAARLTVAYLVEYAPAAFQADIVAAFRAACDNLEG